MHLLEGREEFNKVARTRRKNVRAKVIGLNSKPFILTFEDSWLKKGDIIEGSSVHGIEMEVIKVYKFTWWRKLLFKCGIPFTSMILRRK